MTTATHSSKRMSPWTMYFIVGVLPILSLVAVVAYFQVIRTPAQPTIEDQFIPGLNYETYVIGTELTADAGIGFANSRCQFSFDNVRLAEAMFINASVDGPADVCSIATSIQWVEGEDFTPWKTSVGGDALGPANDFTDHEPYPVAIAYRLRFTDGEDTGWGHNEEIILRKEGGPDRMTNPQFVD